MERLVRRLNKRYNKGVVEMEALKDGIVKDEVIDDKTIKIRELLEELADRFEELFDDEVLRITFYWEVKYEGG